MVGRDYDISDGEGLVAKIIRNILPGRWHFRMPGFTAYMGLLIITVGGERWLSPPPPAP